jgi:hypothetical protein
MVGNGEVDAQSSLPASGWVPHWVQTAWAEGIAANRKARDRAIQAHVVQSGMPVIWDAGGAEAGKACVLSTVGGGTGLFRRIRSVVR